MRVTTYERVSSLMMTAVFGACVMVVGAFVFWLTHRPPPIEVVAQPLEFVELEPEVDFGGSPDGVVGGTAEYDTGQEGGGGEASSEEMITDAVLTAVESAATTAVDQSLVVSADGVGATTTSGPAYIGMSAGNSSGTGTGGGRPPLGFGPGKGGGVPRELRWFIKFADDSSIDEYAKQLDYFKVELGVLYPDGRLVYISKLSQAAPTKREIASGKDEQRLYFTWQGGERQQGDIKLLAKAGVTVGNARILHFYTPETENQLAVIERNFKNRKAKEIRRTYFVVVKQASGYTFQVTRQTYLL